MNEIEKNKLITDAHQLLDRIERVVHYIIDDINNTSNNTKTPHKHAELIKQWADGATIQAWSDNNKIWIDLIEPAWHEDYEFRVKPEVTPWYENIGDCGKLCWVWDGEDDTYKMVDVVLYYSKSTNLYYTRQVPVKNARPLTDEEIKNLFMSDDDDA